LSHEHIDTVKGAQIVAAVVEGCSIRATVRMTGGGIEEHYAKSPGVPLKFERDMNVGGDGQDHSSLRNEYTNMRTPPLDAATAIAKRFSAVDPEVVMAYALMEKHGVLQAIGLVSLCESRMRRLHERARRDLDRLRVARTPKPAAVTKISKPSPVREDPAAQPISYRSFISEEELARLNQEKNKPQIDLGLPENDPFDCRKGPKAA
jgi:hypothetical protein